MLYFILFTATEIEIVNATSLTGSGFPNLAEMTVTGGKTIYRNSDTSETFWSETMTSLKCGM